MTTEIPRPRRGGREGRVAQARRAAILKAATGIFLKKGFGSASLDDVIAEVGGSKATIYGHFQSKEGLFAAVMAEQTHRRGTFLFDLPEDTTNIELALSEIGWRFLQLVVDETSQALRRISLAEADKFPELARIFYETGPKAVLDRLQAFIQRAHDNGHLNAPDAELAAWQFTLLCQTKQVYFCDVWGASKPTDLELELNLAAAMRTFLAAFGPRRTT